MSPEWQAKPCLTSGHASFLESCSETSLHTPASDSLPALKQPVCLLAPAGDADYVVPYTGTRAWVYDLNLKQSKPWHSWHIPGDDQVSCVAD